MKRKEKNTLIRGIGMLTAFAVWTLLIRTVDVQPVGVNGTDIGFAGLNTWFHRLTGVHMSLYIITDWLGLVSVFVCMAFAAMGLMQLIQRKSLLKVDTNILLLGAYYIVVIGCYLAFEMIPINYRPILIDGRMEASYPSSTTLLVLAVMPTLVWQVWSRPSFAKYRRTLCCAATLFSAFMVAARLISGVHWLTDIIGAVLLSGGLYGIYKAGAEMWRNEEA
jgi:undecaprenyl-diphosphatase